MTREQIYHFRLAGQYEPGAIQTLCDAYEALRQENEKAWEEFRALSVRGGSALEAEREAHKRTREALLAVEWAIKSGNNRQCPQCYGEKRDGHAPDCIVGKALAEERGNG